MKPRSFTSVFAIFLILSSSTAPAWGYYNPRLGRFMQRDPVGPVNAAQITPFVDRGAAFQPVYPPPSAVRQYGSGRHAYEYCGGRPLVLVDPTGQAPLFLDELCRLYQDLSLRGWVYGETFLAAHGTAIRLVGEVLAAAGLYALATNPETEGWMLTLPGGMGLLAAEIEGVLSTAGSIRGLLRTPAALKRLIPPGGFQTWQAAEEWVAATFGGKSQVSVNKGWRYIDQLSDGAAFEVKWGYKAWSTELWEQIKKDGEILRKGLKEVTSYTWLFFKNPTTGGVGADPRVLQALDAERIPYHIFK